MARGVTQSDRVRIVPVGKGFIIPRGPTCYLLGPGVTREVLWPVPISSNARSPDPSQSSVADGPRAAVKRPR